MTSALEGLLGGKNRRLEAVRGVRAGEKLPAGDPFVEDGLGVMELHRGGGWLQVCWWVVFFFFALNPPNHPLRGNKDIRVCWCNFCILKLTDYG